MVELPPSPSAEMLEQPTSSHTTVPVPMPRWTSTVGVTRLVLALLVLGFVAAATAICGGYAAFGVGLFTASATFVVFTYYYIALSLRLGWYNAWVVLVLEIVGTGLWLVSVVMLAVWTGTHRRGSGRRDWTEYGYWDAGFRPEDIGLWSGKVQIGSLGGRRWNAGVALAGTASGLGAVECFLFVVISVVFGINFHQQHTVGRASRHGSVANEADGTAMSKTDAKKNASSETDGKSQASIEIMETASPHHQDEEDKPQVVSKDSNSVV